MRMSERIGIGADHTEVRAEGPWYARDPLTQGVIKRYGGKMADTIVPLHRSRSVRIDSARYTIGLSGPRAAERFCRAPVAVMARWMFPEHE